MPKKGIIAVAGASALGLASLGVALPAAATAPRHPARNRPARSRPARNRVVTGTVSSLGPDSFVLQLRKGQTRTVDTSAAKFRETGDPSAVTAVAQGDRVMVTLAPQPARAPRASTAPSGSSSSAGTTLPTPLVAKRVEIILASVSGKVTSVGSDSFVLTKRDGVKHTVVVNSDTEYLGAAAGDQAVTVGQEVRAYGTKDSGTTLTALFVHATAARTKPRATSARPARARPAIRRGAHRPSPNPTDNRPQRTGTGASGTSLATPARPQPRPAGQPGYRQSPSGGQYGQRGASGPGPASPPAPASPPGPAGQPGGRR